MKTTRSRCLILSVVLMCGLLPEVTADDEEASDGLGGTQEPIWLTDVPAAVRLIGAAEVAMIGFFPVDNEQLHLDAKDIENLDAAKLSRFIQMNNLHWVTEYSPMIAAGLFNTMVQTHLLLMMNKASPEYEASMRRYQETAKLFQGRILFVLVDSGRKEHGKVISYFKLKESQLPALAIYDTVDNKWDTVPIPEVTVEKVQGFCEGFLKGELLRDHRAEEGAGKEEL
ncbi:endoplasmic reticulum resident protein 27 isoform X2 [Psammomys obesus]|uniref:endoplasmic reticulum resident protein 27 isoform X2 n=1 Tax=Psammomys obesus TaxID=48139 RepID=UPI00245330EA|nr:endoplasmic reticulum resident protein 27 isoform X2 [Psammomys obesus]